MLARRLAVLMLVAPAALAVGVSSPSPHPDLARAPGCGEPFRAAVSALSDARALRVNLRARRATVRQLARLPRSARLHGRTARTRPETRTYQLDVRLVAAKGSDIPGRGDIDVVVADARTGATMIVTFPDPHCEHALRSPERGRIAVARSAFVAACGAPPTTHFAQLRGRARIVGVAFFSQVPGPVLAARNGVELSPVLRFATTGCRALPELPVPVAAAGDIACDPGNPAFNGGNGTALACRMRATSDLFVNAGLSAVLPLGDLQYDNGELRKFTASYKPTWGRFKSITRPVPGNHEYRSRAAAGYFAYFGRSAGDPDEGYYSYDLGPWHLVALNSQCAAVGGCDEGSPQERWLRADLAANDNRCVLAYWHTPRFSSGGRGNDDGGDMGAFWRALYEADADVVLNGHDHDYERFAPQTPDGELDLNRGLREFVVGTGGARLRGWGELQPNSEVRQNTVFGVLWLTLRPTSYDWRFVSEAGKSFEDAGSSACH